MKTIPTRSAIAILVAVVAVAAVLVAVITLPKPMPAPSPAPVNEQGPTPTPPTPETAHPDWQAAIFDGDSVFKYPVELGLTYVHAVDPWPPTVTHVDAVSCEPRQGDAPTTPESSRRTINGQEYCVSRAQEGAAGSTYTTYAYATETVDGPVRVTFTIRTPQCLNYDSPEREACQAEQRTFDVDALAVDILASIAVPMP